MTVTQVVRKDRAESLEQVRRWLMYDVDEVIVERFTYQRRQKVELFPVEVIGVVRHYCGRYNIPMFEQSPAQAKNLWTDAKIKQLKLWEPNKPHGMDALRHLLYHETVTKNNMRWVEQLGTS